MNLYKAAKDELAAIIKKAYEECVSNDELPGGDFTIEAQMPAKGQSCDLCSPFAFAAAKALKCSPRKAAGAVCARMKIDGSFFEKTEAAGAGYINVYFSSKWYSLVLSTVQAEASSFGCSENGKGKTVIVEYVSANPTGPMTLGNARGGVLGDTIASVLSADGYDVWREFYLNDTGNQVEVLGRSLEARYLQTLGQDVEFPEDGYHGDYVLDLAKEYISAFGDSLLAETPERRGRILAQFALPKNISAMERDLGRYNIRFDCWFKESSLHESGYVDETMAILEKNKALYEKDGALWFKATDFGADKDEVLRKSNGFYTYYAADIAYHRNKFETRAFDMAIVVLGADHHGHALRFPAAIKALGIDPSKLKFVLLQLVRLTRDGETVRMSKRTGKSVTLSDLLDEIPVDPARFFFNLRQADSHLEFDLGLAVRQSQDNPVFYVQYAHARICSLLENVGTSEGVLDSSLLIEQSERELLAHIAFFQEEVRLAAEALEPSRINRYAYELASRFHRFYNACRIKEAPAGLREARLSLVVATKTVLQNALNLLGVSAPESM